METDGMPFVAIIGGLWQLDQTRVTAARLASKQIGSELAKAGFGLVVYFSTEESMEPHVVAGYVESLPAGGGKIRVRYAESQRGTIRFDEEATRREIFEHSLFPGQDWEVPFYRSLAEEQGVDAVVLLAGATSTLIAGQIAVARRLPILAIDDFGGSAAKIWNQLAQASPETPHGSWSTSSPASLVDQLKNECSARAARRSEARRREQVLAAITARRRPTAYAAGAFIALLAILFFGIVFTPYPVSYPFIMFAGLIAAGSTGGLIRALIWGSNETEPRVSLVLGSVAGFIVGLAYLIPQWVGAPGVLVPNVQAVSATDKIQFLSSVLVAVSAGVGFDTVFNRLQKEAEDVAIGPFKKQ